MHNLILYRCIVLWWQWVLPARIWCACCSDVWLESLVITILNHRHLQSSPIITMCNHHHVQSSPCAIITMCNHHHVQSWPCAIITMCNHHHVQSSPCAIITMCNHRHVQSSPCAIIIMCNHHQSWLIIIYNYHIKFIFSSFFGGFQYRFQAVNVPWLTFFWLKIFMRNASLEAIGP
jgi:hypothetical protein